MLYGYGVIVKCCTDDELRIGRNEIYTIVYTMADIGSFKLAFIWNILLTPWMVKGMRSDMCTFGSTFYF